MEKRTLAKKKIYDSYVFSTKEKLMYGAAGMIFTFAIGYIFYRRIGFSVLLSFLGLYYLKMKKKQSVKKQKQELNVQFKDLLYFLSTSLSAGRSLENAFESSLESLQRLYRHEESHIVAEVMIILGRLKDWLKRDQDILAELDVKEEAKEALYGKNLLRFVNEYDGIVAKKLLVTGE
jgi:tight adherence protein B